MGSIIVTNRFGLRCYWGPPAYTVTIKPFCTPTFISHPYSAMTSWLHTALRKTGGKAQNKPHVCRVPHDHRMGAPGYSVLPLVLFLDLRSIRFFCVLLPPPSSIRYQSRTPNAISIIFLLINLNHTRFSLAHYPGVGDPGFDTDVQLDTLKLHFPFRMINFPPIRVGGHGSDSFLVCRQTKPVYCFNLSSSKGKTKQSQCHNAVVDDDGDGNEVC